MYDDDEDTNESDNQGAMLMLILFICGGVGEAEVEEDIVVDELLQLVRWWQVQWGGWVDFGGWE